MKKSKFIQSTLILIVGGFFTKILGMIIRIVMTRLVGTEGIGIYMLISPTFMLFIAIAQLGMPTAISKLVAEDKRNNRNLVFSAVPISLFLNGIIMIVLILSSTFIANTLLHEPRSYIALICMGFVLPFISISSILRGYFFGKQRMIPHVISNLTEDVIRLLTIIIGLPIALIKGIEFGVAFLIFSNLLSELTSILVLFFFLPKNFKLSKKDIIPDKTNVKDIMTISLPTTGSRLIGTIGSFFEPIILTTVLLSIGYSNSFIVNEYGVLNGYVMPFILLPSFFTMAISQALLPVVSNAFSNQKYQYVKDKIKQAIFFSLLIGIPATIIFTFFPEYPLQWVYNTSEGLHYIKVLAPICLLHYIQAPLVSSLQAIGKAKEAMKGTLFGMIGRTVLLFICCNFKIGLWGLVIATGFNIIFVTFYQAKHLKRALKKC